MSTKNCHYISEYLLKPWLIKKGKVRVFDYTKSLFEDRDTETLFSRQFLFTQEQENFFNKYIETITQQELSSIAKGNLQTKKWKNYRALLLFIFDLVGRYTAAKNGKMSSIEFLTDLNESQLDSLASAIKAQYTIGILTVPNDGCLCFPSNLVIPIFDPKLQECHFGVPFDSQNCLFLLKNGYDQSYLNALAQNHTVINLSIGNNGTDLVVIHPSCLYDEMTLGQKLIQQRAKNQMLANQIGSLLAIIKSLEVSTGIKLTT